MKILKARIFSESEKKERRLRGFSSGDFVVQWYKKTR